MLFQALSGSECLTVTIAENVARVVIDNPQRKNAVDLAGWRALAALVPELAARDDVRAIVLTGAGADFCAGADISEFDTVRKGAATARVYEGANSAAFAAIRTSAVPVIAAIRGICFGGGFGLAAACDLRIATHDARFAVPAARLGLAYPQDAMVDIVGAATAWEHLAPESATCGPINVGGGSARTAHGLLPVPAPATAELLQGLPIYGAGESELVTPTGAVLLAELVDRATGELPRLVLDGVGYGLGKRDTPGRPNAFRLLRGSDQCVGIEIAFAGRRAADVNRVVRGQCMRGSAIGVGINSDAFDARLAAGANHAKGNLATVGNEEAANQASGTQPGCRLARNARSPSWPSGDTRCFAMASVVIAAASAGDRPHTCVMSRFDAAIAEGEAVRHSVT